LKPTTMHHGVSLVNSTWEIHLLWKRTTVHQDIPWYYMKQSCFYWTAFD